MMPYKNNWNINLNYENHSRDLYYPEIFVEMHAPCPQNAPFKIVIAFKPEFESKHTTKTLVNDHFRPETHSKCEEHAGVP